MRVRSATALLACVAVASACSGTSKPQVLPTLKPTPTATSAAVAIPSAATVHNAFGAAAFVRFYYAQVNAAYSSASADPIAGLADIACGTCKNYVQATKDLAAKGQRIRGNAVSVVSAEAPPEANGFVAVDVFLRAPGRAVVDTTGQVLERLAAGPARHKTVYLMRTSHGWLVRAVKDAT